MSFGSRIAGALAKLPPAATRDVSVERDLAAKMPDGATLLADRWYPTIPGGSTPPTVLMRSPYGRRQLGVVGRLFAERGYQVVIQSCRGTFGSSGEWEPMRNEQSDGHATLEWIAGQPWFDGQLVTFGPSYLGLTQWSVAEDPPDFLRAMALNVTSSNFRDAIVYPGGSYALELTLTWLNQVSNQEGGTRHVIRTMARTPRAVRRAAAVLPLRDGDTALIGRPAPFVQDWLAHDTPGDPWWDSLNFGRRLAQAPPATLVGGWYDLFLPAQIADYEALRAAHRPARLTVGPWTHSSLGGLGASIADGLAFFDEQLKAVPARRQPVRLLVMGRQRWQEFGEWPPAADRQKWYLGRNGTLGTDVTPAGPPDAYRYDPADPTPGIGGPSLLSQSAGPKDQKARESRRDVLTYTSALMTGDVTVIGPVSASLHLRASLEHTDFFVRLCDVSPKGKSTNLCDGVVRLIPGAVEKQEDGTFRLDIALWPTANTFKIGHRVRLQVSSGAHPLFTRNLGTGEPLATGATLRASDQEVWHDETHQSFLTLPVVPGGTG
jgi:putative CocE/NonD family hydrolase